MNRESLPVDLSRIGAAGMLVTGALGLAFPRPLAQTFGLPSTDAATLGFTRATSTRDAAIGAILLSATMRGSRDVLRIAVACGLGISVMDLGTVYFARGRRFAMQQLLHIGGAAYFAAILSLLLKA